jgi:hypothetical protein
MWRLRISGTSKEDVEAKLAAHPDVEDRKKCPASVVTAIEAAIASMPEPHSGRLMMVESGGHAHVGDDGQVEEDSLPNFVIRISFITPVALASVKEHIGG